MRHIKAFEAETSAYEPPKFIHKPYPGDTGFEITRQHYNRFLWTNGKLGKKGKIDKGDAAPRVDKKGTPLSEAAFDDYFPSHAWDEQNPAEISGMGLSQDFPSDGRVGYRKQELYLPSEYYPDPDEEMKKKKLKKLKSFEDFK